MTGDSHRYACAAAEDGEEVEDVSGLAAGTSDMAAEGADGAVAAGGVPLGVSAGFGLRPNRRPRLLAADRQTRTGHWTLGGRIDGPGDRKGVAADFRRGIVDLLVQLLQCKPDRGHASKRVGDVHNRTIAGKQSNDENAYAVGHRCLQVRFRDPRDHEVIDRGIAISICPEKMS